LQASIAVGIPVRSIAAVILVRSIAAVVFCRKKHCSCHFSVGSIRKLVFCIAFLLQLVVILSQDCCSCRRKLTLFLALLLQLLCAICWFAYWVCDQFSPVLSLEKEKKKKQELSF